jgi:transforming growth factor-beta-induced protein
MVLAGSTAFVAACGGSDDGHPAGNLAQVAQQQGFTALLAAVDKAGIGSVLADPAARLTVFAPTDAAFGALATRLGFANATAMVTALPAPALASILQYHVLPQTATAAQLAALGASPATAYTFGGAPATLGLATTGGVTLTDAALTTARVTTADVPATNGVVHVVDKVLVPPGVLNLVQMAQVNPLFSTLVGAVVSANLQGTLAGPGPFTVFAPTNDAFAAIATTVAGLSTAQLTSVLTYHVLPSQVLASGIPFGTPVATVQGQTISFTAGTPPTIADSTTTATPIVATNVRASNGVIHVVGRVLLPRL